MVYRTLSNLVGPIIKTGVHQKIREKMKCRVVINDNCVGPEIKTKERPAQLFYPTLFYNIKPHKIIISTTMKFGILTVAAFALIVGPVLGKASGGLRSSTKVRVDFRIAPMISSVFWLTELFFLLLVHFLIQTGRTQPCCSIASQTLYSGTIPDPDVFRPLTGGGSVQIYLREHQ
jgi:hypothetical protein